MVLGHYRIRNQLDAFVDGELPLPAVSRLESHLDECPDCDAHVRMLLAIKRSLARVAHHLGAV